MEAYHTIRAELRRLRRRDLLELTRQHERRWCNVRARECGFFIQYKGLGFCLTELLGRGCSPGLALGDETEMRGGGPTEVINCLQAEEKD